MSDPKVIKIPRYKWWPILNGIILPFRAPKSAELYKKIWKEDGSPLISISKSFVKKCSQNIDKTKQIKLAMSYGNPSIESQMTAFAEEGIQDIQIVPMFPQYSDTTTGSIIAEVTRVKNELELTMKLQVLNSFHTNPAYIDSLVTQIKEQLQKDPCDCVLLSFHGIPKSYADAGDIYSQHCIETFEAIKNALPNVNARRSYQSRFGKEEWLKPYTDEVLLELAQNKQSLLVLCPGFAVDCLETIDEINREYRHIYESNNGPKMVYLSCLNDDDQWCKQFSLYINSAEFSTI